MGFEAILDVAKNLGIFNVINGGQIKQYLL